MTLSLRARVVFPVDGPPIEGGVVTVEGERIVAVGREISVGEVFDLGHVALFPGLVNAHTHLEFSHLQRPLGAPGMPLVDWIRLVLAARWHRDVDRMREISAGVEESYRGGTAIVGEIAQGHSQAYDDAAIDLHVFLEVIGFSRARAESALAAIMERLDAFGSAPRYSRGLSPHAPYTVSPQLLRGLIAVARERELPVAMHLAESLEELKLLSEGTGPFQELLEERSMWDADAIPGGSRPLDYLRMLAEAPRALVIHGNYLDDEERAFLAANAHRMSLVYCPRTHAYFRHPAYPLEELLAGGVRVALGTDSRASNPDLDLLAEMRWVAQQYPAVDARAVLRMGTLSGAEALGRDADVGSITPGKLANLVAVPIPDDANGSADELLAAMLAGRQRVCGVWLRGERFS